MSSTTPSADVSSPGPAVADWILVGLLSALSAAVGVFGVFFLPAYVGAMPMPIVVVVVGLTLALVPRVAYRLTHRLAAAAPPVLTWFVVTVWLSLSRNSLYNSTPVAWQGWQFALLLGVGALSAAGSVGLLWGDHLRAEIAADRTRGGVVG